MSLIESTLQDLANTFSLPELKLDHKQHVTLSLGDLGEFSIENKEGKIILRLSKPFSFHVDRLAYKALKVCSSQNGHIFPVRAGLYNNMLNFMVLFNEQEFSLQSSLEALALLRRLHTEVGV